MNDRGRTGVVATLVLLAALIMVGVAIVVRDAQVPVPGSRVAWAAGISVSLALVAARIRRLELLVLVIVVAGLGGSLVNVTEENDARTYRIDDGPERTSLRELASADPNRTILGGLGWIFELEQAVGDATIIVPDALVAARIRAFTELDVRLGRVTQPPPLVVGRRVGEFMGRPVSLVGEGDTYFWRDSYHAIQVHVWEQG